MSRIYEAIKRAEESRSKSEWESGSSLGVMEMPDRRRSPRREPGMKTALNGASSETLEEIETSATLTLDSAVSDKIFLLPPLPEFVAETDPFLRPDESIMDSSPFPVRAVVEALEKAFSHIIHECVVETNSLQTQEVERVVEIAPAFSPSRDVVSTATFPILETAVDAEHSPSLAAGGGLAHISACAAQESAKDVSRTGVVAGAKELLPPSSLLAFYGLNQQPFDVTPDPAYLYLSPSHREALMSLSQGIEHLRGFVTLVAHPGLGKTTLLNKLTEELGDKARVVHLFQTQCNSSELLRYLLNELGVDYDATDVVSMHRILNEVLFQEMLQGRRFVLIVDEAQNLEEQVLETIRLLSDFETTHSKLIQIILAGQPQLVQTLLRPNLSQLRQRIGMVANLEPLDATEVAEYVEHRLRTAGWSGKSVFTRDALNLIAKRSEGTPRNINNLCFNALVSGYSMRQEIVGIEVVERVAKKLDLEVLALSSLGDQPHWRLPALTPKD